MSDLLECLYTYAAEHLIFEDPAYRKTCARKEDSLEAFRNSLTPQQVEHLNAIGQMLHDIDIIQSEAMFKTALSMGLPLGMLNRA